MESEERRKKGGRKEEERRTETLNDVMIYIYSVHDFAQPCTTLHIPSKVNTNFTYEHTPPKQHIFTLINTYSRSKYLGKHVGEETVEPIGGQVDPFEMIVCQ